MTTKLRVFGYCRVSSEEQAREGISLDLQRARIEAFCEARGWELLYVYEDAGQSAKNTDRPALRQALADLKLQEAGALVFWKLDRVFRNTADALRVSGELSKAGIEMVSISEAIDTTSAMGRFVYTLMAALATLEREQISDRTRLALARLQECRRVYAGLPYGYRRKGKKLLILPQEMEVIRRIIRMRRDEGLSYDRIAAILSREGIPSPRGLMNWGAMSVRNIYLRATGGRLDYARAIEKIELGGGGTDDGTCESSNTGDPEEKGEDLAAKVS